MQTRIAVQIPRFCTTLVTLRKHIVQAIGFYVFFEATFYPTKPFLARKLREKPLYYVPPEYMLHLRRPCARTLVRLV